LFWLAGLAWISPYALLTAGNNKWLTRALPAGKENKTARFPSSNLIPA
jgi:hypothetical protein